MDVHDLNFGKRQGMHEWGVNYLDVRRLRPGGLFTACCMCWEIRSNLPAIRGNSA